jgi:hypothetical protein
MITQFEHHITKSLKSYYKRKLRFPTVFLAFIAVASLIFPIRSLLFPADVSHQSIEDSVRHRNIYFSAEYKNLYFSGYTRRFMGRIDGYYYYTMQDGKCVIVLLSPDTCQMGISNIDKIHFTGKIIQNSVSLQTLFTNLSRDLSWNEAGISEVFSPYILSEPDANGITSILLKWGIAISVIIALLDIIYSLFSIAFPVLSHPIRRLMVYGNPGDILEEAEEELSTLPQLATEDMFITQHYFIETSKYGVAVVPIDKIEWIYKYSTLHKIMWKILKISYTLYITADKFIYIRCPKNIKSDIDGVIDYLSEANHDILVGFSENNRRAIEERYESSSLLVRIKAVLMKRI